MSGPAPWATTGPVSRLLPPRPLATGFDAFVLGLLGWVRRLPGRLRAIQEQVVLTCHELDGLAACPEADLLARLRDQREHFRRGTDDPTALIAAGSVFFSGALRSIRALNLEIPADLSFVGADDSRLGEIAGPTITVIDRDMREAGRQAAGLLLDRFAGVSLPPRRIMLTSNVLLRRSVGPVRQAARAVTTPAASATS